MISNKPTIRSEIVSRLATDSRIWRYTGCQSSLKNAQDCIKAYEEAVARMLYMLDIPIEEDARESILSKSIKL